MTRFKKSISVARKFTASFLMLIFFINLIQAQAKKTCNIEMELADTLSQDTIYGGDLSISTIDSTLFYWYWTARIISIDSVHKQIDCLKTEPRLGKNDSLFYRQAKIATVYLNTKLCQIKKDIHAPELLSKPSKEITAEYARNLSYYKKNIRINPAYSNENYLSRYCVDLTYAALGGDSLAVELLLKINKDFKLFRDGYDAVDLYHHREILYNLLIVDKPKVYRERYNYLNNLRY